MKTIIKLTVIIFFCIKIASVFAQNKVLYLNIYEPGQPRLNMSIIPPVFTGTGSVDNSTQKIVTTFYKALLNNISYLPFLNYISHNEIIGNNSLKGVTSRDIDFHQFVINRVDLLLTIGWSIVEKENVKIEVRSFDVYSAAMFLGRGYILNNEEQAYLAANKFCALLMKKLTGKSGFFESRIAFVKKGKDGSKNIFISTPQGYLKKQITFFKGIVLSPSWSWNGEKIVFTYLTNKNHKLLLWKLDGTIKQILIPGNTIISPTFTPQGNIVVSSDMSGNPDIYLLDENFKIKESLIHSWAIDISPSFDKTGEKMVYVSSIYGNPNIFLYNLKTKEIKRISYLGKYNTNPCISSDGRYVVYSTLTQKGHRIVLCDMDTMEEKIITEGPGNDEHPVWGPDGYFIAFTSNRTGEYKIYMTTKDATPARVVYTGEGEATSVAWSKK